MSYAVVLRSRATRAAATQIRAAAAEARDEARQTRNRTRMAEGEVERALVRRVQLGTELGTWPYWGPPTRDLWDVLVALPDAEAA